ncbi:MAG: hypothetical protein ACLP3R_14260, partial [Candidatus Korobacteraceae bacterium]
MSAGKLKLRLKTATFTHFHVILPGLEHRGTLAPGIPFENGERLGLICTPHQHRAQRIGEVIVDYLLQILRFQPMMITAGGLHAILHF